MVPGRPNLGQMLRAQGVITAKELDRAIQHQILNGGRLGEALVEMGLCSDADIAAALARQLEIPFIDLEKTPPLPSFVALVPDEVAREFGVLPVRMQGRNLLVAALDPLDIRADEVVRQVTKLPITLVAAPEQQLKALIEQYYSEGAFEEGTVLVDDSDAEAEAGRGKAQSVEGLAAAGEEVSTVRLVNTLIGDAVRKNASDIHIEPDEHRVRVRYRIDGRLHTVVSLHRRLLPALSSRVKIMAAMDIAENRKPQDGGCRVRVDQNSVELRCSTLPGVYGEIIVIRILRHDDELVVLEKLGLLEDIETGYRRLLNSRQGMLLITGPTGSGKSTTLYAGLSVLNEDDINIITVEDPVEMKIQGINQVQVHDKAGRTFPATLRAMLRQDPDIIMVGEIRDLETAEIAARAALTGHLVLSTLHTQSSLAAPARLADMGVPPYMISASVNGVIAQRLLRRVCRHCAQPYQAPGGLRLAFEKQFGDLSQARFARGAGCNECHNGGHLGRVGVFELMVVDDDLSRLIAGGATTGQLEARARSQGFRDMEQDAFVKACQGVITPEEVLGLGMGLAMQMDPQALQVAPETVAASVESGTVVQQRAA